MMRQKLFCYALSSFVLVMAGCGGGSNGSTAVAVNDSDSAADTATMTPPADYSDSMGPGYEGMGDEGMGDEDPAMSADDPSMYMTDESMSEDTGDDPADASIYDAEYMEAYNSEDSDGLSDDPAAMYGEGYPGYEDGTTPGDETYATGDDPAEFYGEGYTDGESGAGADAEFYGTGANGGRGKRELTYLDKAENALRSGKVNGALNYLHAYAVTADREQAAALLAKMGWSVKFQQPVMAIRWGVGVQITGHPALLQDPKPIGVNQPIPMPGGQRPGAAEYGGGDFGGEAYAGGDGADYSADGGLAGTDRGRVRVDPALKRTAGELGEKIVSVFTERLERGDFGKVLMPNGTKLQLAAPASSESSGANTRTNTDAATYESSSDDDIYDTADYGGGAEMYGGGIDGAASGGEGARAIARGITFLGIAKEKELLDKARDAELDAMLLFDVELRPNLKLRLVLNETRMSVINVTTGRAEGSSRKLNNVDIQRDRAKEKQPEIDPVDRAIKEIAQCIDEHYLVTEIPTIITPENVIGRIKSVLNDLPENPLPILAEIRMYNIRGLLTDELMVMAFDRIVPGVGERLVNGTEQERKEIVEQWLKEKPSSEETAED